MKIAIIHRLLAGLLFCGTAGISLADSPAEPALEAQLLDALGDDDSLDGALLDGVAPAESPRPDEQADDLENQLLEELDDELDNPLDGVPLDRDEPDGSDVELSPQEDDPLGRIGSRMRSVEQRLRDQRLSGETTRLQQAIVADLDQLLEELRQQQRQQKMQASGSSQKPPSQRTQAGTGGSRPAGDPNGKQSQQPASDSTPGVRETQDARVNIEELDDLIKEVWGHLPETAREQMRQTRVEKFHPKYELLIEKVYRRMAEQQDRLR